jgi:hypothetical protein
MSIISESFVHYKVMSYILYQLIVPCPLGAFRKYCEAFCVCNLVGFVK